MADTKDTSKAARLAFGLGVAAVLGVGGYWLARAVMIALAPQSQWVAPLPVRSAAVTQRTLPPLDAEFDAFHRTVPVVDDTPADLGEDAPETTLSLVLRMARASGPDSSAIIQTPDRAQKAYILGDEILAGVTLESVSPGFAVINRSGQLERLSLRDDGEVFGMSAEASDRAQVLNARAPRSPASGGATRAPSNSLKPRRPVRSELREQQLSDVVAGDLIQNVTLTPIRENGRTKGFRIGAQADANLSQFGLENGDIVTKINGADLTKGRPDMTQLMDELSRRPDATLVIIRDDALMTVRIGLQ